MEESIFFDSKGLKMEGLLAREQGESGVVVTHPHPQYGGDMHNNVVEALIRAYGSAGYSTLRFNFRGVGRSEGQYDEGIGEKADVLGAVAYLRGLGISTIDLAGYSFGAWVNALGIHNLDDVRQMIMVSPPVNFIDFSFLTNTSKIRLIIGGTLDDIAPPHMIKEMLPKWNKDAEMKIISGADHFYWGQTGEIETIVRGFLNRNN